MSKSQKGSITLFALLSMILVASCILTLLEASRGLELQKLAVYRTRLATEVAFSNYNVCLWENYHLLGCNLEQVQHLTEVSANGGYKEAALGTNLLLLRAKEVEIEEYTLLTDGDGTQYIMALSTYMKQNIMYETAKAIYDQYMSMKVLLENHPMGGNEIDDALECLEDLKSEAKGGTWENPLETVKRLQKTQLLELVVSDTTNLSDAEYDLSKAVSYRELNRGTKDEVREVNWSDRILMQQYLLTYFADYTNPQKNRGMNYELEYLLAGKASDIENLREVVNQLLLLREAANLAYLYSDVQKLEVAQGLALALAGFTANGWIIEAVKLGLIAAWAFGESVLDVRALLQGKKIPLIKSKDTWTLDIRNLGDVGQDYLVAKESDMGIPYKTYLGALLLLQKDKTLAYRAMDIQEMTMQKAVGSLRLDQLVIWNKVKISYQYAPIFPVLSPGIRQNTGDSKITIEECYGYYD